MSDPAFVRRALADAWADWLACPRYVVPTAEVYALVASLRLLPPCAKSDADWQLIQAWRMWQDDPGQLRPPAYVHQAFADWMRAHGLERAPFEEARP